MNQGNGITASNLTKVFKGGSGFKLGKLNLRLDRRKKFKALDSLFLEVSPGESFGLIGPNGAGKTTFLSILLG
ncbi:MAG: ATP-binding cassette domain-containing protein, partial [Candidatus Obscuribacterales bacterium]|nr:ATP-binding cassette domain-containing protein [Candidatus Obscuribacterales bacterium]